ALDHRVEQWLVTGEIAEVLIENARRSPAGTIVRRLKCGKDQVMTRAAARRDLAHGARRRTLNHLARIAEQLDQRRQTLRIRDSPKARGGGLPDQRLLV